MPRNCKKFEINRIIYSNSEILVQFLKPNVFYLAPESFLRLIFFVMLETLIHIQDNYLMLRRPLYISISNLVPTSIDTIQT